MQSTNYANPKRQTHFVIRYILVTMIHFEQRSYRVPKCDVIKKNFFFLHFSIFMIFFLHISVEHDEKPPHTKFDMNRFMVAQDMAA